MAVNWQWKNKMGSITFEHEHPITKEKSKYTDIIYCGSNCMAVFLYEFKEDGSNMYRFITFIDDSKHLKNIEKSGEPIFLDKVKKTRLNMYFGKDAKYLLDYFVKQGHKVECYYEEPKVKK